MFDIKKRIDENRFNNVDFKEKVLRFVRTKKGIPCFWKTVKKFENHLRYMDVLDVNFKSADSIIKRDQNELKFIDTVNNKWIIKIFNENNEFKITLLEIVGMSKYKNLCLIRPVLRMTPDTLDISYFEKDLTNDPLCLQTNHGANEEYFSQKLENIFLDDKSIKNLQETINNLVK